MKNTFVLKSFLIACLWVLGSFSVFGQSKIDVKGKVIDQSTGDPIIGANVVEKGTTNGTITDLDGKFSLSLPIRREPSRCRRSLPGPMIFALPISA